jgi:hypothetical protein
MKNKTKENKIQRLQKTHLCGVNFESPNPIDTIKRLTPEPSTKTTFIQPESDKVPIAINQRIQK